MRLWVWRNFRIRLPEDWEMLFFSRDPSAGSCAFADRYQYRLELSWKAVQGRPDIRRLVSDYCSKLKLEGQMPDARPVRADSWRGLIGHMTGDMTDATGGRTLTTRFGAYYSGESCLVEVVFVWPEGRDKRLERQILESIGPESIKGGPAGPLYRRWRTFGMDCLASDGLELSECKVEPASTLMRFGVAERGVPSERFLRLGMVSHWLRGPVDGWLRKRVPEKLQECRSRSREVAGHTVEGVSGFLPAVGLARLLGRRYRVEAAAWTCPADGRLYYCRIDRRASGVHDGADAPDGRDPALNLAGGRLSCCAELSTAL